MTEDEALKLLRRNQSTCFLCKWILEDLLANGKLTGYPIDGNGAGTFPVDAKRKHLTLEAKSVDIIHNSV